MSRSAQERYPSLLAPLDNPGASGQFIIAPAIPPEHLIANAYMVPRVGAEWLYFVQADGRLQFPGGKKEPGESHRQALERELLEEAGAAILDASPIGYWLARSKLDRPYRPHLPHPDFASVVFRGTAQVVGQPLNPQGARETREVRVSALPDVVAAFRLDGRDDLAELYLLASELTG